MMHSLCLFLLFSVALIAQSVQSRSAGYGTASIPNTSTFNNVANLRIEFRLAAFSSGRVASIGSILINVVDSHRISITSFYDNGETVVITIPASWPADVLVRIQRDTTTRTFLTEAWRADGTEYIAGQRFTIGTTPANMSGQLDIAHNGGGGGILMGHLAWLRIFNSRLEPDSAQPTNAPVPALIAYELENNGLDSGTASVALTMAGNPAYVQTAVIPQVGETRTVRAGKPFTVNCGDTGASSYRWQQISGPMNLTFSDRQAAAPVVRGADVFGQYTLQCTATTSSGAEGSSLLVIGAVATNDAGVVIPPNSEIAFLLAPMLRSDTSPWPFYDKNRRRVAFEVGASVVAAATAYISTPAAGTVSVSNGSAVVTGTGTSFLSQYAAGAQIVLYYLHADGQTGRAIRGVASVNSDTSLTLSAPFDRPTQTGISHQRWGTGDGSDANTAWTDGINYYDNVLALYVSHYKTGLTGIAQYADQLANLWWLYLDRGSNIMMAPRLISLEGMMLAAERGVLDKAAVYTAAQMFNFDYSTDAPGYRNYIHNRNSSVGYQNFYFGARESGYAWRFGTALGRLHPVAATRDAWLPRLSANIQNHYRDYQCKSSNPANPGRCLSPHGSFRWQDSFWNDDYAEQPWHTGIAMQGLIRYHRWTANTVAQTVMTDWVNFLMNGTQPGGTGSGKLYLDDISSSFAGINCRRHYYWHMQGTPAAPVNGMHAGSGCEGGADAVYGGRDTNNEIISSYGYAYRLTSDPAIKVRGDNVFGGTWGADDGYHGQWAWRSAANRFKTHGQGLCCNDSYLVDRLPAAQAATTPDQRPVAVSFHKASVPGTANVRVTAAKPDATTVSAVCAISPCTVNVDRIQGQHRIRLEYLSGAGSILSASDWIPISVGQE
jgi:hypothetical protein